MIEQTSPRLTPLTPKADRSNPKIRLFEEAILRLRGRWPATATGLCTDVNRLFGFGLTSKAARERMIESRIDEALSLVEALYGPEAVAEVRRAASRGDRAGAEPMASRRKHPHRLRAA